MHLSGYDHLSTWPFRDHAAWLRGCVSPRGRMSLYAKQSDRQVLYIIRSSYVARMALVIEATFDGSD